MEQDNVKKIIEAQREEEKKLMAMKPEVRINGQLYRLRFDMYAFEQVEEQCGGIREAFGAMSPAGGGKILPVVKKLFAILANSQRNMDGLPEDVTGDEITKHESVSKLLEISNAIKAANIDVADLFAAQATIEKLDSWIVSANTIQAPMAQGMAAETADGGPASDKKKNPIKEEHEAKNG